MRIQLDNTGNYLAQYLRRLQWVVVKLDPPSTFNSRDTRDLGGHLINLNHSLQHSRPCTLHTSEITSPSLVYKSLQNNSYLLCQHLPEILFMPSHQGSWLLGTWLFHGLPGPSLLCSPMLIYLPLLPHMNYRNYKFFCVLPNQLVMSLLVFHDTPCFSTTKDPIQDFGVCEHMP